MITTNQCKVEVLQYSAAVKVMRNFQQ